MTVTTLINALEGLGVKVGQPVDATGHTFAAGPNCLRCGVGVPAKRQYTAVECPGRASSLDEYGARRASSR